MRAQLDLLAVPDAKTSTQRWMAALRAVLLREKRGQRVTADDAVRLMEERPELRRPPEVHANAMGALFSTWYAAEPVMVGEGEDRVQLTVMSPRDRNRLTVWRLR